jgi:hypothetical protein
VPGPETSLEKIQEQAMRREMLKFLSLSVHDAGPASILTTGEIPATIYDSVRDYSVSPDEGTCFDSCHSPLRSDDETVAEQANYSSLRAFFPQRVL